MEHALLASPHHLSVEAAARRAEVLALGGTRALADAVVATRLGRTFEHAGFWRTVVAFFVRHQDRLPLERVEPFVEFLHEARHVPARVHGADGAPVEAPVLPHFSMAGRTVASLSALVAEWRGVLALRGGSPIRWSSCGVDGLVWNVDGARWSVVELLDAESLADEGRRMRNCVGTYVERCRAGVSAVYSLRRRSEDGTDRSVLTIDVDAREPCVREALARCNRAPRGLPLELVRQWAAARRMRGKLSSE
jgi:hypothetical protein